MLSRTPAPPMRHFSYWVNSDTGNIPRGYDSPCLNCKRDPRNKNIRLCVKRQCLHHFKMTTTADPSIDEAFLTKAAEAFSTAAPGTLTGIENNDQDGQKLAEDMYQVFISFKSSSTQLAKVDSDYNSSWKGKWDPLSDVCSIIFGVVQSN